MDSENLTPKQLVEEADLGLRGQGAIVEAMLRLSDGQKELRHSVDRLARPHWIQWAILTGTLLTLLVCVIGYLDQIVRLIRAFRFSS